MELAESETGTETGAETGTDNQMGGAAALGHLCYHLDLLWAVSLSESF